VDRELARRVSALTAGLVGVMAGGGLLLAGAGEAAGALCGGAITIANFRWLRWSAARAVRPVGESEAAWRRALWVGASGVRLGLIALVLGIVAAQGWLGLTGLLVSLTALPITVVAEGLRAARLP